MSSLASYELTRRCLLGVGIAGTTAAALAALSPKGLQGQLPPGHAAENTSAYVMAYFVEDLNDRDTPQGVHFAVSTDGLHWTTRGDNKPTLATARGTTGVRDPSLHQLRDGSWVVVAADVLNESRIGTANPNIHIWSSRDLVNWSTGRLLPINRVNEQSFTWSPRVLWDAASRRYGILFDARPTGSLGVKTLISYTTDFVTVTDASPSDSHGLGREGFRSTTQVAHDGTTYIYQRDTRESLVGLRTNQQDPDSYETYSTVPADGLSIEGPSLVQSTSDPTTWWLWGDTSAQNHGVSLWRGNIATGIWAPVDPTEFSIPAGARHATIQPITASTYLQLTGQGDQADHESTKTAVA